MTGQTQSTAKASPAAKRKTSRAKTDRIVGTKRDVGAQIEQPDNVQPVGNPDQGIEQVVAERDRLKIELEAANAQIALLKERHTQVVNQIDWVLDSLHNIVEGER